MTALAVTVLATRTWRRPAIAPFVVWMVALAGAAYTQWQYFEVWSQPGFEAHVPIWWWVVAAVGLITTIAFLALTGFASGAVGACDDAGDHRNADGCDAAISQVWEYWQWLFRLNANWGYPTTIVASLVAAVLYAVMRRPDDEVRQR